MMPAPHVYQTSHTHQIDGIDLSPQHVQTVCHILRSVLAQPAASNDASAHQAVQAWVFGSRATGHARPYSDLDILISEPQLLDWRDRADLADAFEASSLPFKVDVVEQARLAPGIAARVLNERLRLI
jgi:uncharacterized protein